MTKAKKNIKFKYLKRLFKYTKSYRVLFYTLLFVVIFISAMSMVRPWMTKVIVDKYIYTKDLDGLELFSWLMIGVLLLEIFSNFIFIYQAAWMGQSIVRDIRKILFKKIISFKIAYFDKSSVGILVTRAVNDTERVADVFSDGFFEIISDLLKMVAVLSAMLYFDWRLTMIIFFIFPAVLYATRLFQKGMKRAFTDVRKQVSDLNSFVQERISGMKIVQLFGREQEEYQKFVAINEKHKKAWIKTIWYNSIFFPISDLASSITIGIIVWFSTYQISEVSVLEVGTIMMFIQLSQMFFRPLRHIADKFNTLQMGIIAANRIFEVLDTDEHINNQGTIVAEKYKGNVVFKNVHFSYNPNQEILKGINFEVQSGQKIAIVGATGAGKTTISSLINRFYDIQEGEISIDGVNVKDYEISSLRSHISVVLQDVFLFADSIFYNITLGQKGISREQVIKAAKEIDCYDFIMGLPEGLDYDVKEQGAMLSAGQKQLIAFLRAYVNNPSILILDEATSSVDTHTEKLIQQATEKITQNRTSIIIAHRLETIRKSDIILVMDAGHIVEKGTHDQLLTITDGYYSKLYHSQFGKIKK